MRRLLWLCATLLALTPGGWGAGPRWVSGQPYFPSPSWPIAWYTDQLQYFTDPGDLSPYVNHTAADAIVDAAAAVWNVPAASLVMTRGGVLDEDVSSANVYLSSTGVVFPADVQPANYFNRQIAVIYDSDGSVTDLLLGSGASNPSGCRQNAVTESVDSFRGDGHIQHALLVLNGRCTGPAPEQQLQLQYQLMRAFGRVLGLGWSQTNDNVFTGIPRPTYQQALHWPVMHPIDVICGPYTYQCMPSPFTLRDDDISGLASLYQIGYTPPANKVSTFARASAVVGTLMFPNGQGMQGVNVVVRRQEPFWDYAEDWETASSVSGFRFRRSNGNPVSGVLAGGSPTVGMGSTDGSFEGYFNIFRVPLAYDWETWQNLVISTQPLNPLYVGEYSVGPYDVSAVTPSGSSSVQGAYVQGTFGLFEYTSAIPDAAGGCDVSGDGTESAPASADPTGWWNGNLCSYGHASWVGMAARANRSFTFEVTAKDEQGATTTAKMLPVAGIWSASDATGTLPTVAGAPSAFNSTVSGMTALRGSTGTAAQTFRMVIADQRGDGRPDFNYQARVFYADTVTPATVPSRGGAIAIAGRGFRAGNTVSINGTAATVTSWTANSITATAPSLHISTTLNADVTVRDLVTGAETTMAGALSYTAPQPALLLVSAPTGSVFAGAAAATPFVVQALGNDGETPQAGVSVTFSASAGAVVFGACGASTCVMTTDAQGYASTTVTATVAGAVSLSAASTVGTVNASFTAVTRVQTITVSPSALYIAAGQSVMWNTQAALSDNGASTAGVAVQWGADSDAVAINPGVSLTDGSSIAQSAVLSNTFTDGQVVTVKACAWSGICGTSAVEGVGPDRWRLSVVSGVAQTVSSGVALSPVVVRVVDKAGHAIVGAPVAVHQTLEPVTTPCADTGRCPIAPLYGSSVVTMTSGMDGSVTVLPLDMADAAVVCRMAIATGAEGFVSLALERQP